MGASPRRCSPAAVYRYRLATGVNRWFFITDLPTDADGRHRQHKRRGFPSHATAVQAEQHARDAYGRAAGPLPSNLDSREPALAQSSGAAKELKRLVTSDVVRCVCRLNWFT